MSSGPELIGFTGRAGSGKDTAALALVPAYRVAFADTLKSVASMVWNLTDRQLHGPEKDLVDLRWGLTPRQILQRLGTEVGRAIHPETWTRNLLEGRLPHIRQLRVTRVVVTDVRFPNEVAAVRRAGGIVVRIVRPGVTPTRWWLTRWPAAWVLWRLVWYGEHPSEAWTDVLEADFELVNDGTVEDLERLVRERLGG